WTSPNSLSLLGVIGHWIDANCILQTGILGLRQIKGRHNGQQLQNAVAQVIRDWKLESQIGYFVLDNVSSNDTCMELLAKTFNFPALERRLRCFGHIVNLVVKAFFFGSDYEALELNNDTSIELVQQQAELDTWRKHGPIGKL